MGLRNRVESCRLPLNHSEPPRFCHELNPTGLIEMARRNIRISGIVRVQVDLIAIGAISNPSVSASKIPGQAPFPLAFATRSAISATFAVPTMLRRWCFSMSEVLAICEAWSAMWAIWAASRSGRSTRGAGRGESPSFSHHGGLVGRQCA